MATKQAIQVSHETFERLKTNAELRGWTIERFVDFLVQNYEKARERAFIELLRAKGLIVSFSPSTIKVPRNFKPVPVKGKPVSETIIEDREPK
jgi:hypothetical protein